MGRQILKSLDDRASWAAAKEELRKYLGEENPREAAWKKLRRYKDKGKSFGEIVSEIKELAVKVAEWEDVQERLAVEAFLGAIPWPLAKSICSRRIDSLQGALEVACLMQVLNEGEEGKSSAQALAEVPRSDRREERRPARREERRCGVVEKKATCCATASCGSRSNRRGIGGAQDIPSREGLKSQC